jgi:phage shock protein PspC (stress-responsive transcriptional regulator)
MDKSILIGLNGHPEQYRLEADAYDRLQDYLDKAASRLQDDPDRAEVLGDLERSVGDKLSALIGSSGRVVMAADIDGVLERIGAVDSGREPGPTETTVPPRRRRLERIRERQQLTGVCAGLAEYAQVNVDWVRTGFVLGSLVTAGMFGLVYIALIFIMPIAETRAA